MTLLQAPHKPPPAALFPSRALFPKRPLFSQRKQRAEPAPAPLDLWRDSKGDPDCGTCHAGVLWGALACLPMSLSHALYPCTGAYPAVRCSSIASRAPQIPSPAQPLARRLLRHRLMLLGTRAGLVSPPCAASRSSTVVVATSHVGPCKGWGRLVPPQGSLRPDGGSLPGVGACWRSRGGWRGWRGPAREVARRGTAGVTRHRRVPAARAASRSPVPTSCVGESWGERGNRGPRR